MFKWIRGKTKEEFPAKGSLVVYRRRFWVDMDTVRTYELAEGTLQEIVFSPVSLVKIDGMWYPKEEITVIAVLRRGEEW